MTGVDIVRRAIDVPLKQIAVNSGAEGGGVVSKVRSGKHVEFGFDADRMEYGDLVTWGIIDPTKVVRCALQNAASGASLLLSTEAVIAEDPEKKGSGLRSGESEGAL